MGFRHQEEVQKSLQQVERFVSSRKSGRSIPEVVQKFGIAQSTAYRYLKAIGATNSKNRGKDGKALWVLN